MYNKDNNIIEKGLMSPKLIMQRKNGISYCNGDALFGGVKFEAVGNIKGRQSKYM